MCSTYPKYCRGDYKHQEQSCHEIMRLYYQLKKGFLCPGCETLINSVTYEVFYRTHNDHLCEYRFTKKTIMGKVNKAMKAQAQKRDLVTLSVGSDDEYEEHTSLITKKKAKRSQRCDTTQDRGAFLSIIPSPHPPQKNKNRENTKHGQYNKSDSFPPVPVLNAERTLLTKSKIVPSIHDPCEGTSNKLFAYIEDNYLKSQLSSDIVAYPIETEEAGDTLSKILNNDFGVDHYSSVSGSHVANGYPIVTLNKNDTVYTDGDNYDKMCYPLFKTPYIAEQKKAPAIICSPIDIIDEGDSIESHSESVHKSVFACLDKWKCESQKLNDQGVDKNSLANDGKDGFVDVCQKSNVQESSQKPLDYVDMVSILIGMAIGREKELTTPSARDNIRKSLTGDMITRTRFKEGMQKLLENSITDKVREIESIKNIKVALSLICGEVEPRQDSHPSVSNDALAALLNNKGSV